MNERRGWSHRCIGRSKSVPLELDEVHTPRRTLFFSISEDGSHVLWGWIPCSQTAVNISNVAQFNQQQEICLIIAMLKMAGRLGRDCSTDGGATDAEARVCCTLNPLFHSLLDFAAINIIGGCLS